MIENPVRKGDYVVFAGIRTSAFLNGDRTLKPYWRICVVHSARRDGTVNRITSPNWGIWDVEPSEILTLGPATQAHAAPLLGQEFASTDDVITAIKAQAAETAEVQS